MRFLHVNIAGFGKLQSRKFDFGPGLNVIYAPNESGKSTLMSFILTALYGFDQTRGKLTISDLDRFRPWLTPDYRGSLKYELDNRQTFEVFRDFNAKQLTITDINGTDITNSFEKKHRSEERLFAERHTGLDKSTFSNTVFIGHGSSNQLKEPSGVVQLLQSTAAAGAETEHSSAKEAVDKLVTAWRDMGLRESATTTPLGKAATAVKTYGDELENTERKYARLAEDLDNARRLRTKLFELNTNLDELKYAKNRAEIVEISGLLTRIAEIDNKRRDEIERLSNIPPIPRETMEAFSRLEDECQAPINQAVQRLSNEIAPPELEPTKELVSQNESSASSTASTARVADIGKLISAIIAVVALIGGFMGHALAFAVSAVFVIAASIAHNYSKKRKAEAQDLFDKARAEANKLADIEERVQRAKETLGKIFALAKVSDIDTLNELAARYIEINEYNKRIAVLDEQRASLASEDSISDKQSDLERLKQTLIEAERRNPKLADTARITRSEAENRMDGIAKNIEEYNAQLNEIKGRESEVLGNCRNPGDIEADLEQAKEDLADTRERIQALELAKTLINDLSGDVHARYASALTRNMNESIKQITDSVYDEVGFDDNLQINVRIPNIEGQWKSIDCLSWGTREQFYVLLKIALAQYLSDSGETLPLLLDDAFTQSDDDRTGRMSVFLAELARTHQILMFTCHSSHADAAMSAAGVNALRIDL